MRGCLGCGKYGFFERWVSPVGVYLLVLQPVFALAQRVVAYVENGAKPRVVEA